MDRDEILRILKKHKKELKERFGVKRIGLFGSYVRGNQKESSDIDILVEFEKGKKNFDNFMDLLFFLERILGKKVDLITKESISPFLRTYIESDVVYEKL